MSKSWLAGKSILITGASGTIGSNLLKYVLTLEPKVVRALDHHEHGLFQLQQEIGDRDDVRWLLGDIKDADRMRRAMEGIDVVLHTAALKHVFLGEYNPFEIVQTNLLGLQNVIQASLENRVERMIFTSSDKAVNPTNAMGASKLMGERLVAAAQEAAGSSGTIFAAVRFGNVVGSNGSVVPIFEQQIRKGKEVTLTDKRMTRFVMGMEQAVRLVLHAAEIAVGGELFVLRMPSLKISDLADVMIENLAPGYGFKPEQIKIKQVGARAGEKIYEELLIDSELPNAFEDEELVVCLAQGAHSIPMEKRKYLENMRPCIEGYNSDLAQPMTREEIKEFLQDLGVLAKSAETSKA
ncbi:MAG TPA: SDR family NAD(P)-dependent oxidoreductase [Pyrinomonadaceae bacterium]|jgi:FlaA1/EpsC-like NDP-sugar epimerase|nr:SDR family NAD(P)-dependent oxidoreductase [Pyrinomonadaceae bacterium]